MAEGRPAGFWIRALALAIDFVIFFLVQASYILLVRVVWRMGAADEAALRPVLATFTLLFAAVYTIALHAAFGQTIGKLLVGVRVVSGNAPPPVGASVLRFAAYFVSLATLGVGYLMAGLRRDKRALHDLIADTRVEWLARAPAPAAPAGPRPSPPVVGPPRPATPA